MARRGNGPDTPAIRIDPMLPASLRIHAGWTRHARVRRVARFFAVVPPSLLLATAAIALLERDAGVPDASSVYLAAVVVSAMFSGTWAAVFAAGAAFLLYDFLFVPPLYVFTVADPGEWLNLLLLLFVGIIVGQLTALQRSRAEVAEAREREARALYEVSSVLASRESVASVLSQVTRILDVDARMDRVWVALGSDEASERIAADSGAGPRPFSGGVSLVLTRGHPDTTGRWIRVHRPGFARLGRTSTGTAYRVRIEAGGAMIGSIWAIREPNQPIPGRTETRLLAAAANQIGQALVHDRLAAEAQAAEIARESDALKSALLQSVSHDLRTPLATIRAAAGTLQPGRGLGVADQQKSADAIEREVEYLNRMVTNLLDLSRIEGGALRADRDAFELEDLVGQTVHRLEGRLQGRHVMLDLQGPPVEVDAVFLDEAVTNVLENALKYGPPDVEILVHSAELAHEPYVRLVIEDSGPGVPPEALPRIFDKFYRVPGGDRGSRAGTGIGLAVVRGLVEAMGGRVGARASRLGGLAIELDLPRAAVPVDGPVVSVP